MVLIVSNKAVAAECREMIHCQWEQKVRGQSIIFDIQ